MSKKLYYTDPLVAAYMFREFNVVMSQESKTGIFYPFPAGGRADITHKYGEHEIIIYPESLRIFEPKIGDVIRSDANVAIIAPDHHEYKYADYVSLELLQTWEEFEIIQRDGKPFFTPEGN